MSDCNETAKQKDMLCWLYDEDRYASGFGGGYVTKDIRYRERYLLFTPCRQDGYEKDRETFQRKCRQGEEPKGYFVMAQGAAHHGISGGICGRAGGEYPVRGRGNYMVRLPDS